MVNFSSEEKPQINLKHKSTKEKSKQNITRDTEIKSKVTVTRGEVEGDIGGVKGKGCQGTYV